MSDITIRHIMTQVILKAKMIDSPHELDQLIGETVAEIQRAVHAQDQLMTEKDVHARYPHLSLAGLRNMRNRGLGPKYIKTGPHRNSRVYYRRTDIEAWLVESYQLEPFIDQALSLSAKSK